MCIHSNTSSFQDPFGEKRGRFDFNAISRRLETLKVQMAALNGCKESDSDDTDDSDCDDKEPPRAVTPQPGPSSGSWWGTRGVDVLVMWPSIVEHSVIFFDATFVSCGFAREQCITISFNIRIDDYASCDMETAADRDALFVRSQKRASVNGRGMHCCMLGDVEWGTCATRRMIWCNITNRTTTLSLWGCKKWSQKYANECWRRKTDIDSHMVGLETVGVTILEMVNVMAWFPKLARNFELHQTWGWIFVNILYSLRIEDAVSWNYDMRLWHI